MSRKCDICGKHPQVGNNVSHAHNVVHPVHPLRSDRPVQEKDRLTGSAGALKPRGALG
jgi:ribosomal protein L28